jgi:hypothetical protein
MRIQTGFTIYFEMIFVIYEGFAPISLGAAYG